MLCERRAGIYLALHVPDYGGHQRAGHRWNARSGLQHGVRRHA
ncbi:hypothetical protein BSY15_1451 [Acidovorax sp. RAC01]|nr:hypothetical protein BSY15_1451 [Acidovorax sp. RAC01]